MWRCLLPLSLVVFTTSQCYRQYYSVDSEDDHAKLLVRPTVLRTARHKRSLPEDPALERKLHSSELVLEVDEFVLLLEKNNHMTYSDDLEPKEDCSFYFGSVLLDDDSRAAITVCRNKLYYGFFETSDRLYFLEPTATPFGAHVIYKIPAAQNGTSRTKRSTDPSCAGCGGFNLTGDTFSEEADFNFTEELQMTTTEKVEYETPRKSLRKTRRYGDEDDVGYFIDAPWETRPYNPSSKDPSMVQERWLELALAVDYTVIEFHGKDKLRPYLMALMNIVSVIYKDSSLDANLHLVMSRLLLYENKKDSKIKPGNAKKSLEGVNRWNYDFLGALPKHEKPHDIAVWLTREYIGGPSGYAPVAGVCDRSRSTALNKDEGLASAFIIAHEMAHILGLTHDGDLKAANKCDKEVDKGTIMAPTVTATFNRFVWSTCSKEEFHRLIKHWTCLLNPPKDKNLLDVGGPSYTFSMDEQCRMEYGEGYSLCKSFELIEPCTHLWCGHDNSSLYCITKKGPPVEGTQCGYDKWCVDGYCQSVDGRLSSARVGQARDGGWGPWGPWGECSRPCGHGSRTRRRLCDAPRPEAGGADCPGKDVEVEICKNDEKCTNYDAKADICSSLDELNKGDWLPYEDEQNVCRMSCIFWDRSEVLSKEKDLPDGTPCTYENDNHVCLAGKCVELGCDGVENSSSSPGPCAPNCGRSCVNTDLVFRKILAQESTKLVTLPQHATGIFLSVTLNPVVESNQILVGSMFHLTARHESGRSYDLVKKGHGGSRDSIFRSSRTYDIDQTPLIISGAALRPFRFPGVLGLSAAGPLYADVEISIKVPKEYLKTIDVGVQLNYTMPKNVTQRRYYWSAAECHCGLPPMGSVCVDILGDNRVVDDYLCKAGDKIEVFDRDCDQSRCEFRWHAGEWEHCSATCGEQGLTHRQLYCLPITVKQSDLESKPWVYMVEPSRCSPEKPPDVKPCNVKACPINWVEDGWSECSSTCGAGFTIKPFRCISLGNRTQDCGPPPAARWRSCHGLLCPHSHKKPCRKDKSSYCSLPSMTRYCELKDFHKLCCASCDRFFDEIKARQYFDL